MFYQVIQFTCTGTVLIQAGRSMGNIANTGNQSKQPITLKLHLQSDNHTMCSDKQLNNIVGQWL